MELKLRAQDLLWMATAGLSQWSNRETEASPDPGTLALKDSGRAALVLLYVLRLGWFKDQGIL